jgi:hypothetical protein
MDKTIKPSDLKQQAGQLIAAGKMPSLEDLLGAVAETRASYKPKIEAAQALGPDGGTPEQGDYVKDYKEGNYVGALQAGIANTEVR